MYPSRRLWAGIVLAVFLAALGVVVRRPLLLAGSGLVGAWAVVRLSQFRRTLEDTVDALEITQSVTRSGVRTNETVPVTLVATLETGSPLSLEIEGALPTAAVADEPLTLSLEASETDADRTVDVSWPVAGTHGFDEPVVSASDGYVRETLSLGTAPTVTVEPRGPRSIHVGEGGDRVATAYGDHEAGRLGSGLEPVELREYVPSDAADRIDWKATARLTTPHVREYEAATDRRTLLVVDHRASLATGQPGETKLAYLREVALATAESARRLGDPMGLLTVDDDGVTFRLDPATMPATYERIRRRLLELDPEPTAADLKAGRGNVTGRRSASGTPPGREGWEPTPGNRRIAADARAQLATLGDSDDAFAATLRPLYATREGYRERIESKPLYGAVRTAHAGAATVDWTVIFTDDARPAELRETVKLARGNGNTVLVLLAPTVLYEPGGLADVERAYDRYVEFEELRRELARMPRVTALEVGPADRLSAVLSSSGTQARGGRA